MGLPSASLLEDPATGQVVTPFYARSGEYKVVIRFEEANINWECRFNFHHDVDKSRFAFQHALQRVVNKIRDDLPQKWKLDVWSWQ